MKIRILMAVLAIVSWAGVAIIPVKFYPTQRAVGWVAGLFFLAVTFTSAFLEDLLLEGKWYVHLRRSVWIAMALSTIFSGMISRHTPWKLFGVWVIAVILFEISLSSAEP